MRKRKPFFICSAIILITMILWTVNLFSSSQTIYGPTRFVRSAGEPAARIGTFRASSATTYNLVVLNGENGKNRVSSATVKINGVEILEESDFSQQVDKIERSVNLLLSNSISVELKSAEGTFLAISILAIKHSPVADAGKDQQVRVGDLVTLDGRGSYDLDGDLITYKWTMPQTPLGISVGLSNPTSVMPTFVPASPGNYIITLTVNDGEVDSSPDDVVVIAAQPNVAPTAIAGPDKSVITGGQITLDGTGSFDPDGDPLNYQWQMISTPKGSKAFLGDSSSPGPTFMADRDGQYIIALTVNDGELDSFPDAVVVISATSNAPPVADAGDDQIVSRNSMISLDASNSYDPNNDPLSYNWSIVSRTEGSTSKFDDPSPPVLEMLADEEGEYVFRLVVYDGELYSNADPVVVKVVNDPPIVNAGPDKNELVGVPVTLDGSGSTDPNGDPLTYDWDFGDGSTGQGVRPVHAYSNAGTYLITLTVSDDRGGSNTDHATARINNPVPVLSSIDPSSIVAGSPGVTLTLYGDNFVPTSSVSFNNQQYSATFVRKTQLTATITSNPIMTPGNYPVKVINPTPGGGESNILTFVVKPNLDIAIASPTDGETINRGKIMVRGTIASDTRDVGVTVNGIIAEISGNNWLVNNMPLSIGRNTITAVATDSFGNKASKTITFNADDVTQFVELSANIMSGIPPLQVAFNVSTSIIPSTYQMDFDGDGVVDYTGTAFDDISCTYATEGSFHPKVMITDGQGNTYSDFIAITVLPKAEIDTLLKSKWDGMRESLTSKDINGALSNFMKESRALYSDIFNALQTELSRVVEELQDIQLVYMKEGFAKYRMRKNELYGGQILAITYHVYFAVDSDGVWRIYRF